MAVYEARVAAGGVQLLSDRAGFLKGSPLAMNDSQDDFVVDICQHSSGE